MSVPAFTYSLTPTSVLVSQTQQLVLTITNSSSSPFTCGLDLEITVTLPVGLGATDLVTPDGAANVTASPQDRNWSATATAGPSSVTLQIYPARSTTMDSGGQLIVLIAPVAVNATASTPGATVTVVAANNDGTQPEADLVVNKITAGMSVSAYANPAAVGQGSSTTIYWSATGGSHIQLSLNGSIVQDTPFSGSGPIWSGSFPNVKPYPNTHQTIYQVTVLNTSGSQSLSTPVVIGLEPPAILYFTASNQTNLGINESVNLAWETQYGAAAYLTPSTGGNPAPVSLQSPAYATTPGSWIAGTPNALSVSTTLSVTGYLGPASRSLTFTFAPATITYFSYATMNPADGIAVPIVSNGSGMASGGPDYAWSLNVTGPGGPLSRTIGYPVPEVRYFGPFVTALSAPGDATLSYWVNDLQSGDTLTLNGQAVTVDSDGKGSSTVSVSANTEFTLVAVLSGQTISNTVTVTVNTTSSQVQA